MNQIADIQASKFACFSHLTPDVRNEQIKSLFYIERMAGVSNTDISKIDIFDVFGKKDADKALLITSKGEINKRLVAFSSMPQAAQPQDMTEAQMASITAMNAAFMQRQTERLESLRSNKRSHLNNADSYMVRVNDYLRQAWQCEIEMQRITGHTPNFKTEFEKINAGGFWAFHEVKGNQVFFVTRSPIVMQYKNPQAGVDFHVVMGRYKACYDARNNQVTLQAFERNPRALNAYWHPYVNTAGQICFGNAAAQASRLLSGLEIAEYFTLLSSLLGTYSVDSNPYTSLENFKQAAEKGWYEVRPACRRCGAIQGSCECKHCPKCDETYRDHCDSHYCRHCETYERYNCDCCQECGTTTSNEATSHEEDCSYRQDMQTATQVNESDEGDDETEEEPEEDDSEEETENSDEESVEF